MAGQGGVLEAGVGESHPPLLLCNFMVSLTLCLVSSVSTVQYSTVQYSTLIHSASYNTHSCRRRLSPSRLYFTLLSPDCQKDSQRVKEIGKNVTFIRLTAEMVSATELFH